MAEHKTVCHPIKCFFILINTNLALRIEWCRAHARAHRWQEECLLIAEEMRRIKEYFAHRKEWWENLASNPPMIKSSNLFEVLPEALKTIHLEANKSIIEGKRAYALRQADIQGRMSATCESEWEGVSQKLLTMEGRDAAVMVEHEEPL